jgi:hypothetical protein
MDLSKYPLEKLFFFVAGVIPGFAALLVYHVAAPGSFDWFFLLGFLGYRMKLAIVMLLAFIIGNSMTTFLSGFFGMLGGAYGGFLGSRPYRAPHTVEGAPWRDSRWRVALRKYLGADAPNDTILMSDGLYNLKIQMANSQPAAQVQMAVLAVNNEKLGLEIDDGKWARWYEHFHSLVLTAPERELTRVVGRGLRYNLETASVYVWISAFWVRGLRHAWVLVPAALWIFFLAVEEIAGLLRVRNQYSTTSDQITYLTDLCRKV